MDERTKELIAVGTSVGSHCQPCLVYHVTRAREIGISDTDILEAIGIGHMVERGSMDAMKSFSQSVLNNLGKDASGCCSGDKFGGESCC